MPTDSHPDQALATQLAHIVNEQPAFRTLSDKLTRFTPFRVLRVEQFELRHTNTLAWLLDPAGSHGMGHAFLDRFLSTILGEAAPRHSEFVEVHNELVLRADGALVEDDNEIDEEKAGARDRLDILVEGRRADGSPWVVAIEAKINSQEGIDQLRRYDDALPRLFPQVEVAKCYLTLDAGQAASSSQWQRIRWGEEVGNVLREVLQASPPADRRVHDFLSDYLELIEDLSGGRDGETAGIAELANLADVAPALRILNERLKEQRMVHSWDNAWAAVYRRHKAAFDACRNAVRERGAVLVWTLFDDMLAGMKDEWQQIGAADDKKLRVRFAPRSWAGFKGVGITAADGSWNLFYQAEFRKAYGDIEIKLYAAPSGDASMQKALMERLFGKDLLPRPADLLAPDVKALKRFVWDDGNSVKLYTQSIMWEERPDGALSIEAQFDAAKARFKHAVELHTAALRALAV